MYYVCVCVCLDTSFAVCACDLSHSYETEVGKTEEVLEVTNKSHSLPSTVCVYVGLHLCLFAPVCVYVCVYSNIVAK